MFNRTDKKVKMQIKKGEKKIVKTAIIGVITMSLLLTPSTLVWSGDYPAGYLGPGYREYLNDKIRNGYFVEVFTNMENRQEERVNKRNQIEELVSNSYQANSDSAYGVSEANYLRAQNAQEVNWTIQQNQNQNKQTASNLTEFKYIKYSDGKIVNFQAGLPSSIENERVVDEFGNLGIKHTYNMKYNYDRLLTDYEADLKDNLGNITRIFCYGITYSPDSLFYGGYDTNANKNETEKYIKEVDSAGNVTLTHWKALSYDGKLLRAFSQEIEDSVYGNSSFTRTNIAYENNNYRRVSSYHEEGVRTTGLDYELDRTNITYNDKHLITGYHEEIIDTNIDGSLKETTVDAQFKYLYVPDQFGPDVEEPDPDRLLESIITTSILNPDGSKRTETVTTSYDYNADLELVGASGDSVFTGQEALWWEYKDSNGHILSKGTDENGNTIYTYVDPETGEIVTVPEAEVTATLKEGSRYEGSSEIQYEILYGMPMISQVDSGVSYYHPDNLELLRTEESTLTYNNGLVNNLRRLLDTQEHTEVTYPATDAEGNHQIEIRDIATDYIYTEYGNLIAAVGLGTGSGYEFTEYGWKEFQSNFYIEYDVILGEARQTRIEETRQYED
ncbi:MAG: hypothetical protein ABIH76_03480 [Candidatus Bathyarchaeota archaeon]